MTEKDAVDAAIQAYLAPDMDGESAEMISTWLLIVGTTNLEGDSATHVITDRVLPRWQVKGALLHALDCVREMDG